ncbi:unnamed protein product [Cylindrotheca closterium]|uniref:Uncharacterized protein n=1 Tax=Cylindrotheca closterium TaxID=2856 RepID=A0AAD2CYT1_9STRA|nr:unnamed protein product [Cylindrotheca closterium]
MNHCESSDAPFDERRKPKPQNASPKATSSLEESSQTTETTATATISTLASYSESKVTQRKRQQNARNVLVSKIPRSDGKLARLQKEWKTMSPKRLFSKESSNTAAKARNNGDEQDKGDAAFSPNNTKSNASVSLPQEQLNDLRITHSESTELSAETEHLRYLREKVERQVQSMSQLLLESASSRSKRRRGSSTDVAQQQFQALSNQVLTDFLDDPKAARIPSNKHRHREKALILSPQSSENMRLEIKEARREIEELQRQLTDHEMSFALAQGDSDPQVVLLHQQRSKLQRRTRELLQDTAELRQERNSYQNECLEQSRRIHSLEDSLRQLEDEKKDSEKSLYRYISALQDKSTQLLEELQESRRMLQHESQSRIEASSEAKHRIAVLEKEKTRLQRTVSRSAEATHLSRFEQPTDNQRLISDQPVISNIEAIAGHDRIEKVKSEVELRRAKIHAMRQKRTHEVKTAPPNILNSTSMFHNRATSSSSPVSMTVYSTPRSQEKSAKSPMSLTADRMDDPPGMQLFLQRIDAAMEEGTSSFANQNVSLHLQQELMDLKHDNAGLKLRIEETEENTSVLESKLQEAANRKEKLANELTEHRASAAKQGDELKERKQQLERLSAQLSECQKECYELKERAKKVQGLELGQSALKGVIESHKSQKRAMASQIDDLEMAVVDLEMANGSLQDTVFVLEGDLKQQEGLIAKLSGDLQASSSRETSTRKELEAAIGAKDVLQGKIAGKSIELEGLQQDKASLEVTVRQLEFKQLEMTKKLETSEEVLSKTKEETGKLTEDLDAMRQEVKKLRTEKGAQVMALSHADHVQNELASRLATSELALKEQVETSMFHDEEVTRLIEKCFGIKSETSSLTADDGGQDIVAESMERQSPESILELEFAETSDRRRVLERQLRDLNSQFQSLRLGGEASGSQSDGLGKNFQLLSLESAIEKLRMDCDTLESKNTHLQQKNDSMVQLVSDSEQLRKQMEKVISEHEIELETLRQTSATNEAKTIALQTERTQLAGENEMYASIQAELETRLSDATRLIDSSLPRIKELEAKVEGLNKDVTGRDIVLNEMGKERVGLTEKVKVLNNAVEFWVQKCSDLESAPEVAKEEEKSGNSDGLIVRVKEQLLRLSDVKAEVMQQLFRTAGSVDYELSTPAAETSDEILADIEDLHYVLDTTRQFIVASREATMNLDRTIESLRDEKSLLVTRNTALERIIEEQRSQSNQFEQLLSTMRVIPCNGSVGSFSVAVQSRAVQTEPTEEGQSIGIQTAEHDGKDANIISDRDRVRNEHERLRSQLDRQDDDVDRSLSPISEINTNDDNMSNLSWTELSEVDSKNDSLKQFPACDDISDLSQGSSLEPINSFLWKEHAEEEEASYSIAAQPPSAQLETIASAESFQQLRTPRVSNSTHPERIGRQQEPPEYCITLGALSPAAREEPSPIDRYAIEESSEFGKDRTKFAFV